MSPGKIVGRSCEKGKEKNSAILGACKTFILWSESGMDFLVEQLTCKLS